jgi:hypothetical protein
MTVSTRRLEHLLKGLRRTADEAEVGAEQEQAQLAVEELVAHYQAKARAVARSGVAVGASIGVLVGAVPLSPLRAAWPIPTGFGFATILGGLVLGILIGYVVGDPRAKLYQRMAEQARLQLQLEQRISDNDARMAQLLTALTARAAAAARRQPLQPPPAEAPHEPVAVPSHEAAPAAVAPSAQLHAVPSRPVAAISGFRPPPLSPPSTYRADTP